MAVSLSTRTSSQRQTATRRERAREELLVTAERLFAAHGIDGVSLRQIASECGYANPATIQYHFGSKEALCEAIIDYRLPEIDRRRLELLDGLKANDPRGVVEAMARPYLELDETSHYAGFLGRLLVSIDESPSIYQAAVSRNGGRRIRSAIDDILAHVPPAVRSQRLNFLTLLMVHAIANRRARLAAGHHDTLADVDFEHELFSAMTAVLRP